MDSYLRKRFLTLLGLDLEAVDVNRRAAARRVAGVLVLGGTIWDEEVQLSRKHREYKKLQAQAR